MHLSGYFLLDDAILNAKLEPPVGFYMSEKAVREGMEIPRRNELYRAERVVRKYLIEEEFDERPRADGVVKQVRAHFEGP